MTVKRVELGPIQSFVGNKYSQILTSNTPKNVQKDAHSKFGFRMEDYCVINEYVKGKTISIVICDGHGSVEVAPGLEIGGYESARFTAHLMSKKLKSHYENHQFQIDIKKMIRTVFDETQHELYNQMVNKIYSSEVDGIVFQQEIWKPHFDTKSHKNLNHTNYYFYQNTETQKTSLIDYGTTCTLVLIVNQHLYVAHVGDSDVFLYDSIQCKNATPHSVVHTLKLTRDHSVSSSSEVKRILKHSPYCKIHGVYFQFDFPHIEGQNYSKSIMPSRSMGHPFLSQFGIIHQPSIVDTSIHVGDCIIVGTDGLWTLNGIQNKIVRLIKKCKSTIQLSNELLQEIEKDQFHLDESQYQVHIRNDQKVEPFLYRPIPNKKKDNILFVVLNVLESK